MRVFGRRRERARERVVAALDLAARGPQATGYQMWAATGLGSGRMYIALAELERDGIVVSGWTEADVAPRRRRWYRLADAAS